MGWKLVARLHDGSEYAVDVSAKTPEEALARFTRPDIRAEWIDVEDGRVRHAAVAAFLIRQEDRDAAINELLRELHARGGGTLEEVQGELERRGIELPEKSGASAA
jgi:hypothetical protein